MSFIHKQAARISPITSTLARSAVLDIAPLAKLLCHLRPGRSEQGANIKDKVSESRKRRVKIDTR